MRHFERGSRAARRRMNEGMGSAGVGMRIEGIENTSIAALDTAVKDSAVCGDVCSCDAGVSDDWKNASGKVHNMAMPTDRADRSLKDCDLRGRVFSGWAVPLRAAYRGIVEDVVKVNATVARER